MRQKVLRKDRSPLDQKSVHESSTLVMGPVEGVRSELAEEPEPGVVDVDVFGLNAVIDCDTPSAKMNCSRSSMFVRPFAVCVFG